MSHFFAYLSRLKNIFRWSLMHNTRAENVQEHSWQVAMIAHALGVMRNERFGGGADPDHAAALAVFHEAAEVLTGDVATPVKYFDGDILGQFKRIERLASVRVHGMLPEDLKAPYAPYLLRMEEDPEWPRVKAADRLCALIKCIEERKAGNHEFFRAESSVLRSLEAIDLPEVKAFLEECIPSFGLTLDELN